MRTQYVGEIGMGYGVLLVRGRGEHERAVHDLRARSGSDDAIIDANPLTRERTERHAPSVLRSARDPNRNGIALQLGCAVDPPVCVAAWPNCVRANVAEALRVVRVVVALQAAPLCQRDPEPHPQERQSHTSSEARTSTAADIDGFAHGPYVRVYGPYTDRVHRSVNHLEVHERQSGRSATLDTLFDGVRHITLGVHERQSGGSATLGTSLANTLAMPRSRNCRTVTQVLFAGLLLAGPPLGCSSADPPADDDVGAVLSGRYQPGPPGYDNIWFDGKATYKAIRKGVPEHGSYKASHDKLRLIATGSAPIEFDFQAGAPVGGAGKSSATLSLRPRKTPAATPSSEDTSGKCGVTADVGSTTEEATTDPSQAQPASVPDQGGVQLLACAVALLAAAGGGHIPAGDFSAKAPSSNGQTDRPPGADDSSTTPTRVDGKPDPNFEAKDKGLNKGADKGFQKASKSSMTQAFWAAVRDMDADGRRKDKCGPWNNAKGGLQCSEQDSVVCGHMQDAVGVRNITCGQEDRYFLGLGHTWGTVVINATGERFFYDPWGPNLLNCQATPPTPY